MGSNDLTKSWFGCGTIQFSNFKQVVEVIWSANVAHCPKATLNSASESVITVACPLHMSLLLQLLCRLRFLCTLWLASTRQAVSDLLFAVYPEVLSKIVVSTFQSLAHQQLPILKSSSTNDALCLGHSCKRTQIRIFFPHFFNLSRFVCSPTSVDCKIKLFMWKKQWGVAVQEA